MADIPEWLIGIIGVIVGAIIVPTIDYFKKATKQKAHYLAARTVSILDKFIDKYVKEKKGIPYESESSLD